MPRFSTLSDWLAWLETLHPKKIDMSLGRVTAVLDTLSLRPPPFTVITVGGTNGKGSCVALLESIYRQAGFRVGAFTSPHLWRFNERIRMDGRDASDGELVELFEVIDAARGEVSLTYFESSAVAALLHFAQRGAEVAVLEVGMGGRLDAVNAVDADAALIATVDVDHAEWLGNDRESIGREKAGILRGGRPAVIGDRDPPASVLARAAEIGADLKLIGRDFEHFDEGACWTYRSATSSWAGLPRVPFSTAVQLSNAAACAALVEGLAARLPVAPAAVADGIAGAALRGRSERATRDGVEWLFDVAHNPAAARALKRAVDALPAAGRTLAVFGAMHDKDVTGVLEPFAGSVAEWHLARADAERGASVESLAALAAGAGARRVVPHADVAAACAAAASAALPGDRVLVFGSFHLVGPAMATLGLYSTPS